MCIYALMQTHYLIFHIYLISHIRTDFLTLQYGLLNSSDLRYDVAPYESNATYLTIQPYMALYDLYCLIRPCAT